MTGYVGPGVAAAAAAHTYSTEREPALDPKQITAEQFKTMSVVDRTALFRLAPDRYREFALAELAARQGSRAAAEPTTAGA